MTACTPSGAGSEQELQTQAQEACTLIRDGSLAGQLGSSEHRAALVAGARKAGVHYQELLKRVQQACPEDYAAALLARDEKRASEAPALAAERERRSKQRAAESAEILRDLQSEYNPYRNLTVEQTADLEAALAAGNPTCEQLTFWYGANPGDSNLQIARRYFRNCRELPPPVLSGELAAEQVR